MGVINLKDGINKPLRAAQCSESAVQCRPLGDTIPGVSGLWAEGVVVSHPLIVLISDKREEL